MSEIELKIFWSVLAAAACAWVLMRVIGPPMGRVLFRSKPYQDPQLGELLRSGRHWMGSLVLVPLGTFRLSLAGDRNAPHSHALQLAIELRERFPSLVSEIEHDLFEHYLPYKEAVEEGIVKSHPFPQIADPAEVWPHVKPAHVLIEPLNGQWKIEIAFDTNWDIEHTAAAIYSDWHFDGLNCSVRRVGPR